MKNNSVVNNVDDNSELKKINISKIRNEANEIGKIIEKNYDINKLKNEYNSFYMAYPILFDNLVNKKLTLEELNVILNTLDNAQEHFFKSI
jgi:hypothetical protein